MKLVPTEHIPGRCAKHDLQKLIEEFINGEAKVVNVDPKDLKFRDEENSSLKMIQAIENKRKEKKKCSNGH